MDPVTAIANVIGSGLNVFGSFQQNKALELQGDQALDAYIMQRQAQRARTTLVIVGIMGAVVISLILAIAIRGK